MFIRYHVFLLVMSTITISFLVTKRFAEYNKNEYTRFAEERNRIRNGWLTDRKKDRFAEENQIDFTKWL